ncbi:hypothetical protein J3F84DRAFT_376810 [Trichoderma pleuroticola]
MRRMKKGSYLQGLFIIFLAPPPSSFLSTPMMMLSCWSGHLGANLFDPSSDDRTIAACDVKSWCSQPQQTNAYLGREPIKP